MIQQDDSIIIALSGGADSVVLLHVLLHLKQEIGIRQIFAAHINHGLRGEAATADEDFCRQLCEKLEIPVQIYRADVRGLAAKESLSIEEAGRKLRYRYLQEAAAFFDAPNAKIATGHHQNDNAETIVMNLARGAGLRGLCGIPPVNGNVIRPLLDVSRAEIEDYIAAFNLEYVDDASNFSQEYARNRVRHTVLPAIEAAINPGAVQTIANNAAWLRADEEFLEETARRAFENIAMACHCGTGFCHCVPHVCHSGLDPESSCCSSQTKSITISTNKTCPKVFSLRIAGQARNDETEYNDGAECNAGAGNMLHDSLTSLPPSIARRVIRLAIANLSPTSLSNITSTHIQSVLDLAQMKTGAEAHIPGIVAYKTATQIELALRESMQKFATYPLPMDTVQFIPELNMTISVSRTPPDKEAAMPLPEGSVAGIHSLRSGGVWGGTPLLNKNQILHCTKCFNYGNLQDVLILRARKPGDTIVMSSAAGSFTKKLQDYFTDKKTPKQKRDSVPVLASGSDVLWILDKHNPVSAKYSAAKGDDVFWVALC